MFPAEFGYLCAASVAEALAILAAGDEDEEIKVLAGGQSLLPMMKLRLATPGVLLDIGGLRELAVIDLAADGGAVARAAGGGVGGARIGAVATYRSL
ncbi:MAG: FAD binding domain-containing protein, partial [Streptosporangiaceae bacterium]